MVLRTGVGLSVIQCAVHACARMIIAVDVNPARLKLAKRFRASHTVTASREDMGLHSAADEVKRLIGRGQTMLLNVPPFRNLGWLPR